VEITLPSGASVTVKDNTPPGDRFAVQDSVEVTVGADGVTRVQGAQASQWKAFLARVITGWSYPAPLPSQDIRVLDSYPETDEDIDALDDALAARFERVTRRRSPNPPRPPAPTNAT
jgi:hypothetical protein